MERDGPALTSSTLYLDRVGEVVVASSPDVFSWKPLDSDHAESDPRSCLGIRFHTRTETTIKFSDIYAIEYIDWGFIHDSYWGSGGILPGRKSEMYRFVVHSYYRNAAQQKPWVLSEYMFGHKDLQTCQTWAQQLNSFLKMETGRPKHLLVFVHPLCGKGNGWKNWANVAPIFSRAKVETKVNVTQRAGHAFDSITSSTDQELRAFDGIVAVGGDGLFNEILNGLLSKRHKAPYPPPPTDCCYDETINQDQQQRNDLNSRVSFSEISGSLSEMSSKNDVNEPLLSTSESNGVSISNITNKSGPLSADQDPELSFPNDWFRLGIIPSGSTDAIVISTTGVRDPVTSALQIILGKKMPLDIAQVVRWKTRPSSVDVPFVRYAASFAGYGFYGDVIKESEKYRWMGPVRYDYAGTMVFLKHRTFEAEVAFLEAKEAKTATKSGAVGSGQRPEPSGERPTKMICRKNCIVCGETNSSNPVLENGTTARSNIHVEKPRWLRSKGRFLSIGGAIISCRNERAPDGLVADAHLADGFLHLILIKDCPRPFYLWHLTQLTRRGSDPFRFEFVEHHKTTAFTFRSAQDESFWNLDGELLQACQVSVQVCRGLVNLFASGPEV